MDIVVWLRSLGLGEYEPIFRENDIDEAVLPSLTHENLKELENSRVSQALRELGPPCDQLQWKAASRHCMQLG